MGGIMTQETTQNYKREKATNLLNKIFNSWVKVRYDEETDTQYRKPLTKEQIDNSQKLLNEVKNIGCDDAWVNSRTIELQSVVNHQRKREFKGLKYIPILIILYSLNYIFVSLYMFNPDRALQTGKTNIERKILFYNQLITFKNNKIADINNEDEKYAELSDTEKEIEIAKSQKTIEKYNKKIEKCQDVSDGKLKASGIFTGLLILSIGTVFLLTGIFYKKSLSPPQYLRDFREIKAAENKDKPAPKFILALGAVGIFLINIYFGISKFFMKQEGTITIRTTYSDSSTTDETVINPFPLVGCAMAMSAFFQCCRFHGDIVSIVCVVQLYEELCLV
jgi:hypothetical protein